MRPEHSPSSRCLPHTRRACGPLAAAALLLLGSTALAAPATPPVDLTGTLDVVIKEDFQRGRFEMDYFLRPDTGNQWRQLRFERTPPGHLRTGQRVRVRGQPRNREVWVEALGEDQSSAPADAAMDQALTARRAVVLMVDLTNAKASTRYTLAGITGQMYSNARSVDGLYREASIGALGFEPDVNGDGAADVYGPFIIPYDNSTCSYYDWAYAAESAAQAAGVNLSLYQHRVFVLPRYSDLPACSWAGIANVGCGTYCRAWIGEGESGMVYAHELGHNLNMAHASTDPENDGVVNSEYGDGSDPMGSSRAWHVFNAGHIDQHGWYAAYPGSVATVTASGTYEIAPISPNPSFSLAPEILKIAKPSTGEIYYLSYRQPVSYDATLTSTYTSGVNVHRYRGSGYGYTYHIRTLADGVVFSDAGNGITVTQLSHGTSSAVVRVDFGCSAATPSLSLSPASRTVTRGAAVSYSVSVTNRDGASCGPTTFALATGGIGTVTPTSLNLAGGQVGSATVQLQAPLTDGSSTVQVTATDVDGAAPAHPSAGVGSATLMVDGTAPSTPTGLAGSADRRGRVTLKWVAATDTPSGVSSYQVLRGGVVVGSATSTGYTDTATTTGTTYSYQVKAVDGAGNLSAASAAVSVTTTRNKR